MSQVIGTTFIGLQVLAYNGLIVIPWHVWEERTKKSLDLNKDGKLDAEDAKVALRSAVRQLPSSQPSAPYLSHSETRSNRPIPTYTDRCVASLACVLQTTVLKYGLASSGGFTLGFALGLKQG